MIVRRIFTLTVLFSLIWAFSLLILSSHSSRHTSPFQSVRSRIAPPLMAWGYGGIGTPLGVIMKTHDVNGVRFSVADRGQLGKDIVHGSGAGWWPGWTSNNYVYGAGLVIGCLVDLDADGTRDTVVVTGYDTRFGRSEFREGRVGQDPEDPLARVFSSTILADLDEWPDEFRNGEGEPLIYSLQDIVTIYNDISGDPVYEAGRCGIEVRQRSMAFVGGLNANTILAFFEITNRSDSLPDGPYTFEETYVGFTADLDIGWDMGDDITSILDSVDVYGRGSVPLNTAILWDEDFEEENFTGSAGIAGVFFFQQPGDAWDGVDNDGDGVVDENPLDGMDDDGDGVPDDLPDEVDEVNDFHYTSIFRWPHGSPPIDPISDRQAYRMLTCATDEDCAIRDEAWDVRFMISCGPFDLPPGETQVAGLALVFAEPVGSPDHLELIGEPPKPDPQDPVLSDLVATVIEARALYESGFKFGKEFFSIFGTLDHRDTNDFTGPYAVSANVVDSVPLARSTLHYSIGDGPFLEVPMDRKSEYLFAAEIPGQNFRSDIRYFIQAVDSSYQVIRDPWDAPFSVYDFSIVDVPDFEPVHCEPCGLGLAAAPADFDLDGMLDVLVFTPDGAVLLKNSGNSAFEDVTSRAGLVTSGMVRGGSWGDLDSDGYPDLFVGAYGQGGDDTHILFRNRGDGTFEDISGEAGVSDTASTMTGIWGDVNGDGWLDLYSVQEGGDVLYLNGGSGFFTDGTLEWGLPGDGGSTAAALFDVDDDGDLDLLTTGGGELHLFENDGRLRFVEITDGAGLADGTWNSISTGDPDGDGDLDILFSGPALALYENDSGQFLDVTAQCGLNGMAAHDASWADINADGILEIVTTDPSVLVRTESGRYEDRTVHTGLEAGSGNRFFSLPFDLDGDGLLDLVMNSLWRNTGYAGHRPKHWLGLTLIARRGRGAVVGARADVYAGTISSTCRVSGGEGRSQDSPVFYFGLDTLSVVDSLIITWPSGSHQRFERVAADVHLTVTEDDAVGEGSGGGAVASQLPRSFSLLQNYPNPFNPVTTITFDIPEPQGPPVPARLAVYDLRGRLVRTLEDGVLEPGRHRVVWDGRNGKGESVASGVYLLVLRTEAAHHVRKMLLME